MAQTIVKETVIPSITFTLRNERDPWLKIEKGTIVDRNLQMMLSVAQEHIGQILLKQDSHELFAHDLHTQITQIAAVTNALAAYRVYELEHKRKDPAEDYTGSVLLAHIIFTGAAYEDIASQARRDRVDRHPKMSGLNVQIRALQSRNEFFEFLREFGQFEGLARAIGGTSTTDEYVLFQKMASPFASHKTAELNN